MTRLLEGVGVELGRPRSSVNEHEPVGKPAAGPPLGAPDASLKGTSCPGAESATSSTITTTLRRRISPSFPRSGSRAEELRQSIRFPPCSLPSDRVKRPLASSLSSSSGVELDGRVDVLVLADELAACTHVSMSA